MKDLFVVLAFSCLGCNRSEPRPDQVTPPAARTQPTAQPSMESKVPSASPAGSFETPSRAPDEVAPNDEPDYFAPKEMCSGGVLTGIESCKAAAIRTQASLSQRSVFLESYCACSIDAMRMNKGSASFDPKHHVPTWAQLEKCGTFAKSLEDQNLLVPAVGENSERPHTAQTPFNRSVFHSENVAILVRGCEHRAAEKGMSVGHRIIYCSCWADAMRSHKDRPLVTPDEEWLCQRVADYREATHQHMTVRQFQALRGAGLDAGAIHEK